MDRSIGVTTRTLGDEEEPGERVRRFRLGIVEGANTGVEWTSVTDRCSIGSHPTNDLVIGADETVSRFHCEVVVTATGILVRDLESRNGTILDGVRVYVAEPRGGSLIRIGQTVLRFDFDRAHNVRPLHAEPRFGRLVGTSPAIRSAFALLDRAARTQSTVLIEGETGTGKELAARAVHEASDRRGRPFVVVDCGALAETLLESELFGHERGAFTGADARRIGAFEAAHGGTVFLDEIGEMPAALQPKLLRVLERKEIRRVGSNTHQSVDVRIVAATNRDLRALVNEERFRSDLFYRLCVVRVVLPPLREHPEDIPELVRAILDATAASSDLLKRLTRGEFLASLARWTWPGNVRELRNFIEHCLVLGEAAPIPSPTRAGRVAAVEIDAPYAESRKLILESFEREYTRALLARHDGNIAKAARAAGIGRIYLHRLVKRHQLK